MAISFIQEDHAQDLIAMTTGVTISLTAPSADDFIFVSCWTASTTTNLSGDSWDTPGGFSVIDNAHFEGAGNDRLGGYFYKISDGTETSIACTGTEAGSVEMTCVAAVFRGVDTSTPIDQTYVGSSAGATNNPDTPAIVTQTNSAWVLSQWFYSQPGDVTGVTSPPSGYDQRFFEVGVANDSIPGGIASKEVTSAGSEDPGVWTITGTVADGGMLYATFALRPAVATSVPGIEVIRNIPGVAF